MENNEIITLRSVYGKTQGQVFYITPCPDPSTGLYPEHVRNFDETTHQMILSEKDKEDARNGKIFIPMDQPIKVQNGTTFNLDMPLEKAQWEAIKHSPFIAPSRSAKDSKGAYMIDGTDPVLRVNKTNGVIIEEARGSYGLADLYVEHVGMESKARNERRKLIVKAQNLILEHNDRDDMIRICKLVEKDMSRANTNDIEDFLFRMAETEPQKLIELYTGTSANIRLLLITALERHVIVKRDGFYMYGDTASLGPSMDRAVETLLDPKNIKLKEWITKETFPEMQEVEPEKAINPKTTKK